MPRRRAVTREQLEVLLALPATETELIRHWTLGAADLTAIERRRGDPNQLGFALQLCAFRYPGRLLRPREAIPELALGFVAGQLGVAHDALATYAVRVQTIASSLALCARSSASARLLRNTGASCGRGCSPWRSGIRTLWRSPRR